MTTGACRGTDTAAARRVATIAGDRSSIHLSRSSSWPGAALEVATSSDRPRSIESLHSAVLECGVEGESGGLAVVDHPVEVQAALLGVDRQNHFGWSHPSAATTIAGSRLASASEIPVTAGSMGSALSRCMATTIAAARTVSAKASGPMPTRTRGMNACGSDCSPAGTGGSASLLCTTLAPSMVKVSGWNSPHRPVLPATLKMPNVVYRCSSRSGTSLPTGRSDACRRPTRCRWSHRRRGLPTVR